MTERPEKAVHREAIFRARGALQRYIYRRIRTKSDAPDLAQEVYVRMLRVSDTEAIRNPQGAHLEVAHDSERRFRVTAGDAGTVAVGTQFDVYRKLDSVEIAQGEIAVSYGTPSWLSDRGGVPDELLRVTTGQQVRIDSGSASPEPVGVNLGGMFDPGDTESFVAFLQRLPGVKVERTSTLIRVIRIRDDNLTPA